MSTGIKEIVRGIKYRHKLTDEKLAERLGYSRAYLTDAINKGGNDKLLGSLQKTFPDYFQEISSQDKDIMAYLRSNLPEILQVARSIRAQLTAKIIVDAQARGGETELEKINSYALDILRRDAKGTPADNPRT